MKKSDNTKTLIYAYEKGYRVNKKGELFYKGRKRFFCCNKDGYFLFTIRIKIDNSPTSRSVYIHRLQAYQKFGNKIFKNKIQVRHLNSNSKDNSYRNIVLGSPSKNSMDRSIEVRKSMAIHASSKLRKFDDKMIETLNREHENGVSYRKLGLKYKIGKSTLSYFFNKALYNNKK